MVVHMRHVGVLALTLLIHPYPPALVCAFPWPHHTETGTHVVVNAVMPHGVHHWQVEADVGGGNFGR